MPHYDLRGIDLLRLLRELEAKNPRSLLLPVYVPHQGMEYEEMAAADAVVLPAEYSASMISASRRLKAKPERLLIA